MPKVQHKGRQSQTEKEFCEILRMADPIVSRFVSEHEEFRRGNEALLERVTVLERALEQIAEPTMCDPIHREYACVQRLRELAQEALDG